LPVEFELVRLATDDRPAFECGDTDLNEFYSVDSIHYNNQLLAVTYAAICPDTNAVIGFFSVSNDSVRKEDAPSVNSFKNFLRLLKREKRFKSTPAVKIGRLAIADTTKGKGLGTQLLDFIKVYFTTDNKTGCRFIVVDSYDTAAGFYECNGFKFLGPKKENATTHLMYFDLFNFTE